MKSTMKTRILDCLESGPKTYKELFENEMDSVEGQRKYLKTQIKFIKKHLGTDYYFNDEDAKKVMFAYEKFLEEVPNDFSMNEFRKNLTNGNSKVDWGRGALRIGYGGIVKNLLKEGKIKKIKRGLYQLTKKEKENVLS